MHILSHYLASDGTLTVRQLLFIPKTENASKETIMDEG